MYIGIVLLSLATDKLYHTGAMWTTKYEGAEGSSPYFRNFSFHDHDNDFKILSNFSEFDKDFSKNP
jgi:hypothetical protein